MNAPTNPTDAPVSLELKVQHPSQAALQRGADSALELVNGFEVTDDATYTLAADELVVIKARATKLDEQRKAITKPMDDAKKAVMDLFRGPLDLLAQAESILKSKMLGYQQEQRRKAEELRLAAEKAAEEERQRLQAEADKLKAEGRAGEAFVKETVASMVVAAPVAAPIAAPKVAGLKTTSTVDFEVESMQDLVEHIAKTPELIALLTVDSVKLRAYVRGLGMACKLPGVRVYEKQGLSASRK